MHSLVHFRRHASFQAGTWCMLRQTARWQASSQASTPVYAWIGRDHTCSSRCPSRELKWVSCSATVHRPVLMQKSSHLRRRRPSHTCLASRPASIPRMSGLSAPSRTLDQAQNCGRQQGTLGPDLGQSADAPQQPRRRAHSLTSEGRVSALLRPATAAQGSP
jgi:hypothetical protein